MASIWSETCHIEERKPLPHDMKSEITVIGAGMAGILIANALQAAGHQVIVLEAGRIAGGQTRNTTAKITSQHGMVYGHLIQALGEERARQYAMANEAAIREYRRMIEEQKIHCDLEERSAYVYGHDLQILEAEANAAAKLGLPSSLVRNNPLPIPMAGAVRFEHQAQFHPLKFIRAISGALTVYEHTRVSSVEDRAIITDRGKVWAEQIVFACHYPFINFPGMFFSRLHQERSYVLALKNAARVDGMWIGSGKEVYSFRNYGAFLLLGGGGHRTGDNKKGGRYEALRQKAREWFPDCHEAACWSAQDCITPDAVPYIGRYAASRPHWFVATGFQKWGMTSSMVSALLLRDLMDGKENPWADVFDPRRLEAESLPGIISDAGQAVKGLAKRVFQIPRIDAQKIPAGHGGIVQLDNGKVGVYKDKDGAIHPVDIQCPHLGCQLEWNPDERSWDCPCHGSRFDHLGRLISGPAKEGIAVRPSPNKQVL